MTASASITERFLHLHDVSTVCPSGLAQVAMYDLLQRASGHAGFMHWLMYLRSEYSRRAEVVIKACKTHLLHAVCSWHVPFTGMFFLVQIAWQKHPLRRVNNKSMSGDRSLVEDRIAETALGHGVMWCQGSTFSAEFEHGGEMFFRLSFAPEVSQLEEAIKRLAAAIAEEFAL
jgi:aromatic amino acid aminotransferase I